MIFFIHFIIVPDDSSVGYDAYGSAAVMQLTVPLLL